MFLFAHNLMIGYAKPGARKDANFLKTTIERFKELLVIADENNASLVLTGKSIATMRLEHWLNILEKISDFDAKIYLIVTSRPSDDLIALHNSGHLTLVNTATKRTFNSRGEMVYNGNLVTFKIDNEAFYYDVINNLFYFNDEEIQSHNIIQTDKHLPCAMLVTKAPAKPFSYEQINFGSEAHDVLMDYVEAIQTSAVDFSESKFIEALKRAENGDKPATLDDVIKTLDAPDDVLAYLNELSLKAEAFDEFSMENL
jgi:hypothetical protein